MKRAPRRWHLAACLAIAAAAGSAWADPALGRLFFTPAERAALDERRSAPVDTGSLQRLQGRLRRQDGAGTDWINGRPHHPPPPEFAGLRVGEARDAASGRRLESGDGMRIVVRRGAPERQP